ncbi:MAG: hypothetical protein NC541_04945 [bacterium]|nr:hypothetical protein [bacterium]
MAKYVIVAHRAVFMRNVIVSALKKIGYEGVKQDLPTPDPQWAKDHPYEHLPMRWEETVQLCNQYQAAAVIADPSYEGLAFIRDLTAKHPEIAVIACGAEFRTDVKDNGIKNPEEVKKAALDAGAKATAVLVLPDPSEELRAALELALG